MTAKKQLTVPKYWKPWPHQIGVWRVFHSGKFKYIFLIHSRQTGKDTTCIQLCLNRAFKKPGSTSAYVGLDNVWINENIYKKRIEGREHWADYEDVFIEPNKTNKEVFLRNPNTEKQIANSRIKFIGFLNDQQLIGSSYDFWYISEASLYKEGAFAYIQPIWEMQEARGELSSIVFNGTPRGIRNNYYELLKTYTGVDDPEFFAGEHGDCYVDVKTIHDVVVPDGKGGYRPLYTPEQIEKLKDRIYRQYGNLNYYYQEYECKFTSVNAGLVYQAIETLVKEDRYRPFNINTKKPVYLAWDISSKGKTTDATACIVFQYINNSMMIYDYYEERGKSLVECVHELSQKEYFKHVRIAALPWDSERSASSKTPLEEVQESFPNIRWHALERERVDRGIQLVREQLPNMIINSNNCDRLHEAFMNYEYKFIEKANDWSAIPVHNFASHAMDALRYGVMLIKEMAYLKINDDGSNPNVYPYYGRKLQEYLGKKKGAKYGNKYNSRGIRSRW